MAADVLVRGKLGQGSFQLCPREVQRIVVYPLLGILQCLEQQVDLAEIARRVNSARGGVPGRHIGWVRDLPASQLNDGRARRNCLGYLSRMGFQQRNLIIGQVILFQIRDLVRLVLVSLGSYAFVVCHLIGSLPQKAAAPFRRRGEAWAASWGPFRDRIVT